MPEPPSGTFELCPVCFWEDDNVQFDDPGYEGGANRISLDQARENFRTHRVSKPGFKSSVRPPRSEEQP